MQFKKPKFWDLKKPNLFSYLLLPLTIFVRINNIFLNSKKKQNYLNYLHIELLKHSRTVSDKFNP